MSLPVFHVALAYTSGLSLMSLSLRSLLGPPPPHSPLSLSADTSGAVCVAPVLLVTASQGV